MPYKQAVSILLATAIMVVCVGGKSIRSILHLPGPSSISTTHYWDDHSVSIKWDWKVTSVTREQNEVEETWCIARGKLTNQDVTRVLVVKEIRLRLVDETQIGLFEYTENLKGDDTQSQLDFFLPGVPGAEKKTFWRLGPHESKEFQLEFFVPTGFLNDYRELSAGLDFSLDAPPDHH